MQKEQYNENACYAGNNDKELRLWEQIDLKVLLAIFSLARPSISQAKVASLLKVSPVTLSKLANSESRDDRRIREKWIPLLSESIDAIDLDAVSATVTALQKIYKRRQKEKRVLALRLALEEYFVKNGYNYQCDVEFWGVSNDTIRFYNEETRRQWFFSISSATADEGARRQRLPKEPFSNYERMKSIQPGDKLSIVYSDSYMFVEAVRETERNYFEGEERLAWNDYYRSIILCDFQNRTIAEEVLVSMPIDGLCD